MNYGELKSRNKQHGTDSLPYAGNLKEPNTENIENTARLLVKDIVQKYTKQKPGKPANKHADIMRKTVNKIINKHEILFKSMMKKLDVNSNNCYSTFLNVMEEMFADSNLNWGRLVSVYAFTAVLVENAQSKNIGGDRIEKLTELAGNYVAGKFAKWISAQGGWDAFDDKFAEPENTESQLWRGLLFTIFGLGALVTMAAVR